jgi:ABC-type sugar transport system ATPase subunit
LTVAQNVGFGLEMLGKPRAEVAATVEEVAEAEAVAVGGEAAE